jgi:DNA-binding CsgD family transcriptional regulator
LDPLSRYGLSNREREVLELVAAGQANREIARRRYITPSTAGVHVSHVIAKLGVANRVQAAALAARRDGPTAQVSARSVRDDQ